MGDTFYPDKPSFDQNPLDYNLCIILEPGKGDTQEIRDRAIKEGYREQDKRHITVLSNSKIETIAENFRLPVAELAEKIQEIADAFTWKYQEHDIYHIEKDGSEDRPEVREHREAYIRAIDMPDMHKFYKKVNETFGTSLPVQFPHITLYTKGEKKHPVYYGIGVSSIEKFKKLNPIKVS